MTWHCITYVWILICLHSYYIYSINVCPIRSRFFTVEVGGSVDPDPPADLEGWVVVVKPNGDPQHDEPSIRICRERERERVFLGEGGALKHHLYAYTCWFACLSLFWSHLVFQLGNYCGIGFLQKDANKCLWFSSIHHNSHAFKHKSRCFWKHVQCLPITQWSIIVSSFPHTCCSIVSVVMRIYQIWWVVFSKTEAFVCFYVLPTSEC